MLTGFSPLLVAELLDFLVTVTDVLLTPDDVPVVDDGTVAAVAPTGSSLWALWSMAQ